MAGSGSFSHMAETRLWVYHGGYSGEYKSCGSHPASKCSCLGLRTLFPSQVRSRNPGPSPPARGEEQGAPAGSQQSNKSRARPSPHNEPRWSC